MTAINSISLYTSRLKSNQVNMNFNKRGIAKASCGNINRAIELISDVVGC